MTMTTRDPPTPDAHAQREMPEEFLKLSRSPRPCARRETFENEARPAKKALSLCAGFWHTGALSSRSIPTWERRVCFL